MADREAERTEGEDETDRMDMDIDLFSGRIMYNK